MKKPIRMVISFLFLAASGLAIGTRAGTEDAGPPPLNVQLLRPVALNYKASKFFITAETSVALSTRPSTTVIPTLTRIEGKTGVMPDSERVIVETLRTSVLGRYSDIELLMNPDSRVLQIHSLQSGYKDRYRLYRHFTDGAYSIKRFPTDKREAGAGLQAWSTIHEDYYPIAEAHRALQITKAEGLFYIVNVMDWNRVGARHIVNLFDPDGLIELTMDFVGTTTIETSYDKIDDKGVASRISGEVEVRKIRIDGRPLDPSANQGNFDFLNYKGGVNLFVDTRQGIVLELSGDLDYVGEVAIKLQSADFRLQ